MALESDKADKSEQLKINSLSSAIRKRSKKLAKRGEYRNFAKLAILNSLAKSLFFCRYCNQLKESVHRVSRQRLDHFRGTPMVCDYCRDNFQVSSSDEAIYSLRLELFAFEVVPRHTFKSLGKNYSKRWAKKTNIRV